MSVIIEPSEQLEFQRPFTRVVKESLHVKNPGSEPIIFKVKTTAPKQYCVRPNAGRIEPNSEIEVQIILQPFKDELPEDYKCKDKFLVQTAPVKPSFDDQDITSMWGLVESEEKASMHQHKIKCVFTSAAPTTEEDNTSPISQPAPPAATTSPITHTTATTTNTTNLPLPISTTAIPATISREIPATVEKSPSASTPVTATPAADSPVVTTTTNTLPKAAAQATSPATAPKPSAPIASVAPVSAVAPSAAPTITATSGNTDKELKEALEKIKRLEFQISELQKEEGIRARSSNTNGRKLPSTVQPLDAVHQHLAVLEKPRPTEGYPPQVVLGVAFLVFILTYLFF